MKRFLRKKGFPPFRERQIRDAFYGKALSAWSEISTLPMELRTALEKEFPVLSFKPRKILSSPSADSHKASLSLGDGVLIETVLMKMKNGSFSACLSTQAGCPVGCSFCATGNSGFYRNLKSEEITDQVLFWMQYLKNKKISGRIGNIVFMGMGEPFFNYAALKKSINLLKDPHFFNMGQRHISVSTFGYPPKIKEFARDFPQVNLAISLHAASDETRNKLVPINSKFNLSKLSEAIRKYIETANRKIFIEYVLISGVNDSVKKAEKLAFWLKSAASAKYFTVNLIPCNETGKKYRPPDLEKIKLFQNTLIAKGINVTIRKSIGREIKGACGQLAANKKIRKNQNRKKKI